MNGINNNYSIKNMLGQEVLVGALTASNHKVDVHTLAPGNYLLTVHQPGKANATKMFVKQ